MLLRALGSYSICGSRSYNPYDTNTPGLYSASAAKDAVSDKMSESKHDAKAEGHKKQT